MSRITKRGAAVLSAILIVVGIAAAQSRRHTQILSVKGYSGQVNLIEIQGHKYVDVQDLAQITHGSIAFEEDRVVLALPHGDRSEGATEDSSDADFSPAFRRSAIQAMAAIREWGGTLAVTVQNGYPIGNSLAGNTIAAHQARAGEAVALASTTASTDADRRALVLLQNELTKMQSWSDNFVEARNSMRAANYTVSENAIKNDEEAQSVIRCAQFLAQMFANGAYQDSADCH